MLKLEQEGNTQQNYSAGCFWKPFNHLHNASVTVFLWEQAASEQQASIARVGESWLKTWGFVLFCKHQVFCNILIKFIHFQSKLKEFFSTLPMRQDAISHAETIARTNQQILSRKSLFTSLLQPWCYFPEMPPNDDTPFEKHHAAGVIPQALMGLVLD